MLQKLARRVGHFLRAQADSGRLIILPITLAAATPYMLTLFYYLSQVPLVDQPDQIPWGVVVARGLLVLLAPAALPLVWSYRRPARRLRWAYDWIGAWVIAHAMGRLAGGLEGLYDLRSLDPVGQLVTTWSSVLWVGFETAILLAGTLYVAVLLEEERSERQRLEGLMTFARRVSNLDFQGVLDETARELYRLLQAHACIVYLWNEQEERLRPVAGIHSPRLYSDELVEEIMATPIPPGHGLTGAVMVSGEPYLCANLEADPAAMPISVCKDERCSAIFAPLLVEGRKLGVVRMFRHGLHPFRQDDIDLAMSFVGQAALLIEHGRVLQELSEISITDSLTGLHNSRFFHATLEREVARAQRYGYPLSLVMLDSDSLKQVNDRKGHQMGDHYLREIARVMRESIRQGDFAFRYAGDEFLVLLPMAQAEMAFQVAERIRRGVEAIDLNSELPCTVSLGVAALPDHADSQERLLAAADEAMYAAKRGGKNRTEMCKRFATTANR